MLHAWNGIIIIPALHTIPCRTQILFRIWVNSWPRSIISLISSAKQSLTLCSIYDYPEIMMVCFKTLSASLETKLNTTILPPTMAAANRQRMGSTVCAGYHLEFGDVFLPDNWPPQATIAYRRTSTDYTGSRNSKFAPKECSRKRPRSRGIFQPHVRSG